VLLETPEVFRQSNEKHAQAYLETLRLEADDERWNR